MHFYKSPINQLHPINSLPNFWNRAVEVPVLAGKSGDRLLDLAYCLTQNQRLGGTHLHPGRCWMRHTKNTSKNNSPQKTKNAKPTIKKSPCSNSCFKLDKYVIKSSTVRDPWSRILTNLFNTLSTSFSTEVQASILKYNNQLLTKTSDDICKRRKLKSNDQAKQKRRLNILF